MKKYISFLGVGLLSLAVFSPVFAQSVSASTAASTKQQIIQLITQLLQQLEAELQTLLAQQGSTPAACYNGATNPPHCNADGVLGSGSTQTTSSSIPVITSLSNTFGATSTDNVYGQNLSNIVNVYLVSSSGNTSYLEWASANGTSLNLAVPDSPALLAGNYNLYITNSLGTSASYSLKVVGNSVSTQPSISSLSTTSGTSGTKVTIYGSGFSTNSTVNFSQNGKVVGWLVGQPIVDSNQLIFTLSNIFVGNSASGVYQVSVTSNGTTSNSVNFTITGGGVSS